MLDNAVVAVGDAIERLAFNVGLARLMELAPQARSPAAKRVLVRLLAPFAPHLAEELWCHLGEAYSVHRQPWPDFDPAALHAARATLAVQVNGRTRATVEVAAGLGEAEATEVGSAAAATVIAGRPIVRTVFVPDRRINLVTG